MSPFSTVSAPSFPSGMQIHNAYQISWDATDKPTLSPTPPDFDYECSATLAKWVPGESVGALPCRNRTDDGKFGDGRLYMFLVVGIPVIAVALIAGCCGVYFRNRRKKVRGREERSSGRGARPQVGM